MCHLFGKQFAAVIKQNMEDGQQNRFKQEGKNSNATILIASSIAIELYTIGTTECTN